MLNFTNLAKMGYGIDEIRRETGVSTHTVRSLAILQLHKSGVRNAEYELLARVLAKPNEGGRFEKLMPSEAKIVAEISRGVDFDHLRKTFGMSKACLKSRLRQILAKLGLKEVEYTLLCDISAR